MSKRCQKQKVSVNSYGVWWVLIYYIDINECLSTPCLNGGTCKEDQLDSYLCQCLPGYTGFNCQTGTYEYIASTVNALYVIFL